MTQILPPNKNIALYNLYLTAQFDGKYLTALNLSPTITDIKNKGSTDKPLITLNAEIEKYLKNKNYQFKTPCKAQGTKFQKAVWQYIQQIPVGQVCTYGDISNAIGGAAIAVGQALKRNPIPVIYPCHRVISKVDLGGYCGKTQGELIEFKKALLKHEGFNWGQSKIN